MTIVWQLGRIRGVSSEWDECPDNLVSLLHHHNDHNDENDDDDDKDGDNYGDNYEVTMMMTMTIILGGCPK